MTAPALFKQADVTRLLKGAAAANWPVESTKLTVAPDGTITITLESLADNDDDGPTEWDD
jgi:hypothetical protein